MKKMLGLVSVLLLSITIFGQAGNGIITRPAILHKTYTGNSATVAHLSIGDKVKLLSSRQKNNYYNVQLIETGDKGWVYKNYIQVDQSLIDTFSSHNPIDSVSVRVVDVDNGLCTIIRLPNNKYVIYDAGGLNTANGNQTYDQMTQFLPAGAVVEMMILSHMDGDHIVAAEQAIRNYQIKKLIWGGYDRKKDGSNKTETSAFKRLKQALADRQDVTESINLNERDSVIYPGGDIEISGAHFKLLCGFGKPLPEWHLADAAERLNGVSIVMKLEYAGNSVLFTGDAIGRRKDDDDSACIATEKFLVDHAGNALKSTILFSPHHGAENGSSTKFLNKVMPEYIIIPAGHVTTFLHPRKTTCLRYLNYISADHILRTDRGDDQGDKEWDYLRIPGCRDRAGDDDIQIDLRSDRKFRVYYLTAENICSNGH